MLTSRCQFTPNFFNFSGRKPPSFKCPSFSMFPFICSGSIHEDPETSGKVSQTSRDLTADLSGQYSNPLSGERYTLRPSGLDYTIFTNYFKLWVRLSTAKNPFLILHNALSTLCQCRSSFPKRKWGICSYHTNKCDISILQQPELHTCITILSRVSNSSSKFMIMRTIHSALHHSPFSEELSDSTRTMRWSGNEHVQSESSLWEQEWL